MLPACLHHVCATGANAKALISKAREDVATMVGGRAEDIIFISGGTEVRMNPRSLVYLQFLVHGSYLRS